MNWRSSPLVLATAALALMLVGTTSPQAASTEIPALVATIPAGATPYGIAITPDGSKVFVSNSTGGSVSVIDTAARAVLSTITSNVGSTPVGISVNPAGTTAYVGNYAQGAITTIDIDSLATTSHNIQTATGAQCIWILNLRVSFDGSKLFLACQDDVRVQVMDLPSLASGSLLEVTGNNSFPTDVAVTTNDQTLVVSVNGTGGNANTALFVTLSDLSANSYLPVTTGAFSVAISPPSGLAYLAGLDSGEISVVDPRSRTSARSDIFVGGRLSDIAITPDGRYAIVSVIDQDVVKFVDLDTGSTAHEVSVGGTEPQSIALSSDGRFLYTANRSGSVGVISVPVEESAASQSDQETIFRLWLSSGDGRSCVSGSVVGVFGSWLKLPDAQACSANDDSGVSLLGWATNPDFPVNIAQRQVDNGWGPYETFDADGRMTGVFIPAGGATLVSAPGTLHAIWSEPGVS